MKSREGVGGWGAEKAAEYRCKQGFTVLAQNVRTISSEIEFEAKEEDNLVFVEEKTRRSKTSGPPETVFTAVKREKLMLCVEAYMEKYPELGGSWQSDVIAGRQFQTDSTDIIHFETAIDG